MGISTHDYAYGRGPPGRVLVRRSHADLHECEDFLPDEELKSIERQPLICRTESDGERHWFRLLDRNPTSADIYSPEQAAALQFGLGMTLLHQDKKFATMCLVSLRYFDESIPADSYQSIERKLKSVRRQRLASRLTDDCLEITKLVFHRLEQFKWPSQYFELGRLLGKKMVTFALSDFKMPHGTPEHRQYRKRLDRLATHEVSSDKLHWLVTHRLVPEGRLADFRAEAIMTLAEEGQLWSARRRRDLESPQPERFADEKYQRILRALAGRGLTGEKLAEDLGVELRQLRDNVSTKKDNGKRYVRRGPLDELMEAGLVKNAREFGGYYRPDDPPLRRH